MGFDETKFKEEAKKQILKCRPGDWNHALKVVSWIKKLGEGRTDLPLIIAAAYIHDIGWRDLVKEERMSFNLLLSLEDKANTNSEPHTKAFLKKQGFSEQETQFVLRLISAADKHASSSDDEEIIVDADNLSKLSIDHLKEKFKQEDWERMYSLWEKEFPKRIKTKKAKLLFPKLLKNLRKSLEPL